MEDCLKVLMVEDDPEQSGLWVPGLRAHGYEVTLVTSGLDAIAAAARTPFDVVLMDISLSGRMTGIEAAARLRVLHPDLALIFTSAHDDGELIEQAKLALPVGYLFKPFHMQELVDAIERGTSTTMPAISNDHDLLVRLDVKLDLVSVQLNEARVQMSGKVDSATLEPRLKEMKDQIETQNDQIQSTQKSTYMILGGLIVIQTALHFLKL